MKKLVAATVVAVFVGSTASARVRQGVRIAYNMASISGDYESFPAWSPVPVMTLDEKQSAFAVGPTMEVTFTDVVSFETGLIMSIKGAEGKVDGEVMIDGGAVTDFVLESDVELTTTYAEMPLLVRANLADRAVYINAGITLGVNVASEMIFIDRRPADPGDVTAITTLATEPFEVSAVVGAGVSVGGFSVGVQYQIGLTDTTATTFIGMMGLPEDQESKNNVLSITVGMTF